LPSNCTDQQKKPAQTCMRDRVATVEFIQFSSYHKSDMIVLGSELIFMLTDRTPVDRTNAAYHAS